MAIKSFREKTFVQLSLLLLISITFINGCAVAAKNDDKISGVKIVKNDGNLLDSADAKNSPAAGRIKISPNSPADAIRVFYKNLREKRFREAMLMTNLRVAVENLSDAEMQDLRADFEPLAAQIPAEIEINGEIVTNNLATVTAKMPDDDETGKVELKEFKLRLENGNWTILTADEAAENAAKREGKNYFFALRIDVHHDEVRDMMDRIAKAEAVYAVQNGGFYTDMPTLIEKGYLPEDVRDAASTGYLYSVVVSPERKNYTAFAQPSVYGKTGKLSFRLEMNGKDKIPHLKSADNNGQPLKK